MKKSPWSEWPEWNEPAQLDSRPLLILDGDECLYHGYMTESSYLSSGHPEFILRPYLEELLQIARDHFQIGFWTAATEDWAELALDEIERGIGPGCLPLQFRWSRPRCSHGYSEYGHHYRKKLDKLDRSMRQAGITRGEVIVIDDNHRAWQCALGNLIHIPAFNGDSQDECLKQVSQELGRLLDSRTPWHRQRKAMPPAYL